MGEENKNEEEVLSVIDFDRNKEPVNVGSGIEVIPDDSLENYNQKIEEEKEEGYQLTIAEIKKYLRIKRKKEGDNNPITDEEAENVSEEELVAIREYIKIHDRKALIRFVNHVKVVTDKEAADLTDEEFLELTSKALILSKFLTYRTKKNFGVAYKKERQRKNKQAKASRKANR